jgi:uncharacterized protein YneF (UPF0154 family)
MKTTGIIFIVLGILFVLFNLLISLLYKEPRVEEEPQYIVAYYIGFFSIAILGVLFIILGMWLRRKAIKKKLTKELLGSLPGKKSA